jgi:riboflavin kinase / FMN adenylyltransferase
MRVVRDLAELSAPLHKAVVTIGNFDGVHLGHREIFRKVIRKAREIDGTSVAFTFLPHPLKVLAPDRAPPLINTYAEKERLIAASCIDLLVWFPFSLESAAISAATFVREILVGRLGMVHLVVGYDYAFGRNREGDVHFLQRQGEECGFTVEVLQPIGGSGGAYSSTRIRALLAEGDVTGVIHQLGRHFNLEGEVVHGAKRGKQLGFPTANLVTEKEVLPRSGVYAVKVRRGAVLLDGVVNIGRNPTFGEHAMAVEVHLIDFHQQIYGETLRIYFLQRLREERTFPSAEELARAIAADIAQAKTLLADARVIEYRDYLDCGYAGTSSSP